MDATPTIRETIAGMLVRSTRTRSRSHQAVSSGRLATVVSFLARLVMQLAGFACLTVAGFTWSIQAGFIVAGVSFFLLSWLQTKPQSASETSNDRR